jgi:hypothetical protein
VSTDHAWGPRVLVFIPEGEEPPAGLPEGARALTVRAFFEETLAVDPFGPVEPIDWVTFSGQALLEVTRGRVFFDGLGTLTEVRRRFACYPEAVWRYLLAAQWRRISQDEHLQGRAALVGDELGSRVITARLVRDLMRLAFLLGKTYAPYPKWFGTAFGELPLADRLGPHLAAALDEGEPGLVAAYEVAAAAQNDLGLHPPLETEASRFFDRPFLVIHGERFAEAIRATITDPAVLALPPWLGGADQLSDSTDVLSYPAIRSKLRALYR